MNEGVCKPVVAVERLGLMVCGLWELTCCGRFFADQCFVLLYFPFLQRPTTARNARPSSERGTRNASRSDGSSGGYVHQRTVRNMPFTWHVRNCAYTELLQLSLVTRAHGYAFYGLMMTKHRLVVMRMGVSCSSTQGHCKLVWAAGWVVAGA